MPMNVLYVLSFPFPASGFLRFTLINPGRENEVGVGRSAPVEVAALPDFTCGCSVRC